MRSLFKEILFGLNELRQERLKMYTYVWSYDIYKTFETEQEALEAGAKELSEHFSSTAKVAIVEVKQVMRSKVPVEIENVSLEEYKKDCNCKAVGLQTLIPN